MEELEKKRCFGWLDSPLMMRYHDEEWDVPIHDDRPPFESLALQSAQAGLSWQTILRKRDNFRRAFSNFEVTRVTAYGEADRQRLLSDSGIVRNRQKIDAIISNAQCFLQIQEEFGSFDRYIWQFTDHKTLRRPDMLTFENIPARTEKSEAISGDLKRRGFRFVGPTICYAFMQVTGMVNGHLSICFRSPKN